MSLETLTTVKVMADQLIYDIDKLVDKVSIDGMRGHRNEFSINSLYVEDTLEYL